MSVTIQTLIEPQQIPAASTLLFTASGPTAIDAMTLYNQVANAACKVSINWTTGGAAAASNLVTEHTMQPGEVYPVFGMIGQVLTAADRIYATAATASLVNIMASGTVAT